MGDIVAMGKWGERELMNCGDDRVRHESRYS